MDVKSNFYNKLTVEEVYEMKEYITQAGKPDTLRLAGKIECAKLEIKWVKMTFGQGGAA